MKTSIKSALLICLVTLSTYSFAQDQEIFTAKAKGFWTQYACIIPDYSCNEMELANDLINKCYTKGYRDCVILHTSETTNYGYELFCGKNIKTTCTATVRGTR